MQLCIGSGLQFVKEAAAILEANSLDALTIQHHLVGSAGSKVISPAVMVQLCEVSLNRHDACGQYTAGITVALRHKAAADIDAIRLLAHLQNAVGKIIDDLTVIIRSCRLNAIVAAHIQCSFVAVHGAPGLQEVTFDCQSTSIEVCCTA